MMKTLLPFLLLCTIPHVSAYGRLKFRHWLPYYEDWFLEASRHCQSQLEDYYTDNRTTCDSPCSCAADCILQNTTGTIQSNMQSAQVLLGLLPTILVYGGPTLAETAVLSTYRPLLAVLLTLGSPAVNVRRLFGRIDVHEPYNRQTSASLTLWSAWVKKRSVVSRTFVDSIAWLLALAAIANTIRTSIYLDYRTICGWRCGVLFLPMAWGLSAFLVHVWAMIAIHLQFEAPVTHDDSRLPATICTNWIWSPNFKRRLDPQPYILAELFYSIASLAAVIQLIIGVFVLASLIFISALEALQIFVLYAASTLVCQTVLVVELAHMRAELAVAS
jgi:hypothetical protein